MGSVGKRTANEAKVTGSYWCEIHVKGKYFTPALVHRISSLQLEYPWPKGDQFEEWGKSTSYL